jgi:hypothetical protein
VGARLKQAIAGYQQRHPAAAFALVPHRAQTLLGRWQALCFAPLVGLEPWTRFETHAHPLETLLGRGYHSAPLSQLLGPLERLDAAEALLPALWPPTAGQSTDGDGVMLAYGSRLSMHKGNITMLGRIRAGSQARIAPHAKGHARFVTSHPPDGHLSQVLVASGHQVAQATGGPLLVIDRAVHAVARACAFDEQGLGLLCLLDENAYAGLGSFEGTVIERWADGPTLSRGTWSVPRPEDPRHCVIVEPAEGKILVDGGTPTVKAPLEPIAWPRVYRERKEMQEHRCKRMMDHGALKTTYGRKTLGGPDRPQQRARATLEPSLAAAHQRVDKQAQEVKGQQTKVAESESKGHGKRLDQRRRAFARSAQALHEAQDQHTPLRAQAAALGPPRERAERDVRTQTLRTVRPRLLENALRAFMSVL